MENPGEHLVGQYLREIKECDFVEYNLQTKKTQGEIDVIGINSTTKTVYICEVATHLQTGLQYTKNGSTDNVNRFIEKFGKNIRYAKDNFANYKPIFMLWSPIIREPEKKNAIVNQLRDINEIKEKILKKHNVDIVLVYNEKYLDCINELRKVAKQTTHAMTSPIMRFLQIEEKLILHCLKKERL